MFDRLKKYYDEKYSTISVYALKTAVIIFAVCLFVYWLSGKITGILSFTAAVLKPLVLGLCFTYLLRPVADRLETRLLKNIEKPGLRRLIAVLLTFIIVLAVLTLIIIVIISTVTKSLSFVQLSDIKDFVLSLSDEFESFRSTIEELLNKLNINFGSVGTMFSSIFSGVKSGASTLLFAVIFSIYFLIDKGIGRYWGGVLQALTSDSARARLIEIAKDADKVFSGYIRGQAIDATLVGVMSSVALLLAGVPYAAVIGILTGLGNLIPYVGPIVGYGSLILVCLAKSAFNKLIIGGVILLAVMFVDGNIINPRLLSSAVEVHPVLVIVALLAGGKVGGIVGMLVSVPVAAFLKIQFEKYMIARKNYDPQSVSDDGGTGEGSGSGVPAAKGAKKKPAKHNNKKQSEKL